MHSNTSKIVSIEITKDIDIIEAERLYRDANWWSEDFDPAFLGEIARKSFCFARATIDGEMVGMGRALSDGVSDAYIQDVVVLTSHRGMGIGSKIILAIVEHLKLNGVDWIGLVGQPGTEDFYRKLGFKAMTGHIPMLLENQ